MSFTSIPNMYLEGSDGNGAHEDHLFKMKDFIWYGLSKAKSINILSSRGSDAIGL